MLDAHAARIRVRTSMWAYITVPLSEQTKLYPTLFWRYIICINTKNKD